MTKLLSFHSDKTIKAKYVDRLKKHHEADQIIQGLRFNKDENRGCAVGCTLEEYSHIAYESELGIPEFLARLEDVIFEGLPSKLAPKFAVDFLTSIKVGVDLSPIRWKFCAFIMRENIERVLRLKMPDEVKEQVVTSIRNVLKLHEQEIFSSSAAWSAARSAARSAAYVRYAKEIIRLLKNEGVSL